MKPSEVDVPTPNVWIPFTPKNDHTYDSSNLRAVYWEDAENDDDFDFGVLRIRFQNSGIYVYDLPWKIFNKLAVRGFKDTMDQYSRTPGEWYSSKFEKEVKDFYRRNGVSYTEPLYVDTTYES